MKTFLAILLSFLLFILISLLWVVFLGRFAFFSQKPVNDWIAEINLKEQLIKSSSEIEKEFTDDEEPGEGGQQLKEAIDKSINELTVEDERILKSYAQSNLNELFGYLTDRRKKEIRIDNSKIRPFLVKILTQPEFLKDMRLPFTICEGEMQSNCIKREDFATFFDQALSGRIQRDALLKIVPLCKPGESRNSNSEEALPSCLTEEEVKQIEEKGLSALVNLEKNEQDDQDLDKAPLQGISENENPPFPDTKIIAGDDIPEPMQNLKHLISLVTLAFFVIIFFVCLTVLFLFLLKGFGSIKWVRGVLILSVILQIASIFIFIASGINLIILKKADVPTFLVENLEVIWSKYILRTISFGVGFIALEVLIIILITILGIAHKKTFKSNNVNTSSKVN